MSNAAYIADGQYFPHVLNNGVMRGMVMIEIRVDELLGKRRRTFYWLAQGTSISHTTLWRLKKGKALGINFETLAKMCQALDCHQVTCSRCQMERKARGVNPQERSKYERQRCKTLDA